MFSLIVATASAALSDIKTIGTGLSQGKMDTTERLVFEYVSKQGAVMNHFWVAGDVPTVDRTLFRYYIDNETTPSIAFEPALACGVGFGDQSAPWGTKWFGKGAKTSGWFHNFRIPFRTIRITYQAKASDRPGTIWVIVRGADNLPLKIGDHSLPDNARMKLISKNVKLTPLEFVDVVNIPSGSGMLFMSSMVVDSGNFNFMEGCYHLYTPANGKWPGMLLSTGMEDYYDSAFYFDAKDFRLPISGTTHYYSVNGKWSGYRFHDEDPIFYTNGLRFQWRNGDVTDPSTGLKCTLQSGGSTIGTPTPSTIITYAWVYVW